MLKFIGTGSAFNTELLNTSAYIKNNDTLLLIDCGETVFSQIKKLNLLEGVKNVYIAITHLHSDHVGSLATLIEYLNIFCDIVPNIILTNDDSNETQEQNITKFLELQAVVEGDFEYTYADMLEDVLPDLIKVELVEIKHSSKLTSYAVELYFKNQTIYYTGDNNDKSYLKSIAKKLKENDLVYADCTNQEYDGRVHVSVKELSDIFNQKQRKQVITMHFDSYECLADAKDVGFNTATNEIAIAELLKKLAVRN